MAGNNFTVNAEKLKKDFDGLTAVGGIDFHVSKGESFGILGPNGAGKTTTIRMISCFMPPTSGKLDVFGLPVSKYPRRIKERIGVCQQEDNLDPDLNVYQNLLVYSRYFNMERASADKKISELLDFVGLSGRKTSRISELSGGMKRRLIVARSLLNSPELLILDEPTTGLDPQARNQVWENVEELKRKGTTFVLTTHYMEEAARLCDRLIIMDGALVIVEGKPVELIEKYMGKYVIEITGVSTELEGFLKENNIDYEKTPSRILVFTDDSESLFTELRKKFCSVYCGLRAANLEDVFFKLTGRELRD